jgi:hypothetical protein
LFLGIELHNEKVSNNRYILNVIINCIRFCGAFELAFRGHDESETSLNPGIFRGLINFTAELDNALVIWKMRQFLKVRQKLFRMNY